MTLINKKALMLALGMAAILVGMNVHAATKPQAKPAAAMKVSALNGKFVFSLPAGYIANAMPAGEEKTAAAGATGTMFVNRGEKRVIIAAENTLANDLITGDNDDKFLDSSVSGFIKQQSSALPDFKQTSENRFTSKGLGIREIDSTATMGGGATVNTTFLAGSGTRVSVVQVISRADDQAGHAALIKRIVAELRAP